MFFPSRFLAFSSCSKRLLFALLVAVVLVGLGFRYDIVEEEDDEEGVLWVLVAAVGTICTMHSISATSVAGFSGISTSSGKAL